MKFTRICCPVCGANDLKKTEEGNFYCCGVCCSRLLPNTLDEERESLKDLLDDFKLEQLSNARKNLYNATHKEFGRSEEVLSYVRAVQQFYPDDFLARFYAIANANDSAALNNYLNRVEGGLDPIYYQEIAHYLIKSLRRENISALKTFLNRTLKESSPELYGKIVSEFEARAQEVERGIYDVTLPRDVFIAYRSTDLERAKEIRDYLEENHISCFMSEFNLQHGINAATRYEEKLNHAMDNCRVLLFVSSVISRSEGDSRRIELPYIKNLDFMNAPSEYRAKGDYSRLPVQYKKPRVEYLIEEYTSHQSESYVKEFFKGFTQRRTKEEVYSAIDEIISEPVQIPQPEKKIKFCKNCGAENKMTAKFCSECGGNEFCATETEYLRSLLDRQRESYEKQIADAQNTPQPIAKPPVQEDLEAEFALGKFFYDQKNYEKAFPHLEKAAHTGNAEAQFYLGSCYEESLELYDIEKALKLYEKAALQGHAKAQYNLGFSYYLGCDVAKDYKKAVEWFEKAAQQGHADAQNHLGGCYELGDGVAKDFKKAVEWYEKAALQGHAKAQYNLGFSYYLGHGVEQDYKKAVEWFEKAAQQGHADAQNYLGLCYSLGRGVEQDYKKAVEWFEKAALQGSETAKDDLRDLKEDGIPEAEEALKRLSK